MSEFGDRNAINSELLAAAKEMLSAVAVRDIADEVGRLTKEVMRLKCINGELLAAAKLSLSDGVRPRDWALQAAIAKAEEPAP